MFSFAEINAGGIMLRYLQLRSLLIFAAMTLIAGVSQATQTHLLAILQGSQQNPAVNTAGNV